MFSRCTFSARLTVRAEASGHQQARHFVVGGDALLLRQQFQGGQAAVACDDFVLFAIGGEDDDQVLQQADAGNARG